MEKLEYIIEDSTIGEVLGVQNFSNEESAVLELVKNAYDMLPEKSRSSVRKESRRRRLSLIMTGLSLSSARRLAMMSLRAYLKAWHMSLSEKGRAEQPLPYLHI